MAELKTKINDASVEKFLNSVDDEKKRKFAFTILELMKNVTKAEPKMWEQVLLALAHIITSMQAAEKMIGCK